MNVSIQKKPNFLIVGAAKCGTTALASILSHHPDCCMSNPKEVSYFQDTVDFQPNLNYEKGWEWYRQAFSHYDGETIVGEATPSYSDRSRSPNTAKRIYEFNPDMKIIYMVRDPLKRQISEWKMQWAEGMNGTWPDRVETQWALKGFDYWMRMQRDVKQWDVCRYGYQLAAYEKYFPVENIYVSFLEDWKQAKELEVERIMTFLRLDLKCWPKDIQENAHRGADRRIERPWLKEIKANSVFGRIVKVFPLICRDWVRRNLFTTEIVDLEAKFSEATTRSFMDYVFQDSMLFMNKYSKPTGLWNIAVNSSQN